MALGQAEGGLAGQCPQPALAHGGGTGGRAGGDGIGQHLRVALAADAVRQHTRPAQWGCGGLIPVRRKAAQALHHCAEGLGDGGGIGHQQHGHVQQTGDVGGAGRTVVQAHHAFDEDEIGLSRSGVQAGADVVFSREPQIDVVNGCSAGEFVPERV